MSRLSLRVLHRVMSRQQAEAVVGDIQEELARRQRAGRSPRWPRLWMERQIWRYIMAMAGWIVPRVGRSFWFVLRDAWRSIRSAPASSAFILLILTVGIAAATVTFSVVDAVVLRGLPFPDAEDVVIVRGSAPENPSQPVASQEYLAWQKRLPSFAALAAHRLRFESIDGDDTTIFAQQVTASVFDVLQTGAALGGTFTAAHEVAGTDRVVVLGHGLWQRRYGGDASIIGRTIRLRDGPATVLGIMPPGFTYPILPGANAVELWTPLVFNEEDRTWPAGGMSRYLNVVGRLLPGVTHEQAALDVVIATNDLVEAYPRSYLDWRPDIETIYSSLVGDVRGWMLLVLWAVGLVMAVTCVNVANLLLTRSTDRARDLAIRASLGAGRRLLLTGRLVESLLLSGLAVAAGIGLAAWGVAVARAALPAEIPRVADIGLDLRVLGVAVTSAVATGLFFGAVPAWQASKTDVVPLLKAGAASVAGGVRKWRVSLLVAEVAFVGILLVSTTLFVSSFVRVTRADLGFDRSRLLAVSLSTGVGVDTGDVLDRLQTVPGIASATTFTSSSPPLIAAAFGGGSASIDLHPTTEPSSSPVSVEFKRVSPAYFDTAGIGVREGLVFTGDDEHHVVLDELAARRLFGERPAVGASVYGRNGSPEYRVVGVVVNVRTYGPEREARPQAYLPPPTGRLGGSPQWLIRSTADPASVIPAVEAILTDAVPANVRFQVRSIEDAFKVITAQRRFNASLMAIFGLLAVLIGAAGTYAVMASLVAQRTREMGIRVALGATTVQIARGVLSEAGRHLAAGLAIGLTIAWFVSKIFASLLFEVRPTDGFVYVVVAVVLLTVGLVAALLPARRAARVDPLVTLRAE